MVFYLRRQTLERNLRKVIDRIRTMNLPAKIDALLIHGSFLRGEEKPGDLDAIMIASPVSEWRQYAEAVSSLREIHNKVIECYNQNMKLSEAARGPLRSKIEKRNIPVDWIATSNWSQLFGRTPPYLSYMLFWSEITQKLLRKGMKGVHIQIIGSFSDFVPVSGRLYLYNDLPLYLIWSSEDTSLINLKPTPKEFDSYLKLEYNKLKRDKTDTQILVTAASLAIIEALKNIPTTSYSDIKEEVLWCTPKYEAKTEEIQKVLTNFGLGESEPDLNLYIDFKTDDLRHSIENNTKIRRDLETLTMTSRVLYNFWHVLLRRFQRENIDEMLAKV